ncbi:hypothetical protein D1F64_05820 [Breoghania sp. L-A4]|nr:hypothetical protein D1F64_05820 [Breoghania sp. L-A4]
MVEPVEGIGLRQPLFHRGDPFADIAGLRQRMLELADPLGDAAQPVIDAAHHIAHVEFADHPPQRLDLVFQMHHVHAAALVRGPFEAVGQIAETIFESLKFIQLRQVRQRVLDIDEPVVQPVQDPGISDHPPQFVKPLDDMAVAKLERLHCAVDVVVDHRLAQLRDLRAQGVDGVGAGGFSMKAFDQISEPVHVAEVTTAGAAALMADDRLAQIRHLRSQAVELRVARFAKRVDAPGEGAEMLVDVTAAARLRCLGAFASRGTIMRPSQVVLSC